MFQSKCGCHGAETSNFLDKEITYQNFERSILGKTQCLLAFAAILISY